MQADRACRVREADGVPFLSLTLGADIGAGVDLLGKSVSDLQSSITVSSDNKITGTLKYVTGYTGFSGTVSEQSGNYIAVKATAEEGAVIMAEVIGGDHGEVTLDEDGILIARIKNTSQKLRFSATTDAGTQTIIYDLSGLTLNEEA